jgi:hypothetical protein
MLKTEIYFIAVIKYECQQKKSHKNATFKQIRLNTKIQLNTRFMFKMDISVFKFAKQRLCLNLHVFFLEYTVQYTDGVENYVPVDRLAASASSCLFALPH